MTKAAIWNQLKTEYEYSSSLLNKLYGVTYQQASKELLESIIEQLQKEVWQGVNEDLSSDVEEVTGNDLITDTNAPINQDKVNSSEVNYIVTLTDYPQVVIKDDYNPKELTEVTEQQLVDSLYTDKVTAEMMFPGSYYQVIEVNPLSIRQELLQHFNTEVTESIWNYKIIQSSWHPDFYHMWMYEGEKGYWYFTTDTMVAEIKLEDLETKVSDLNSLASTKSVTVQSCGTWSNIFTCNDTELAKLLNSQYYSINRDSIMQRSLAVAEIHTQAIKQQDLLKQWQLEKEVATETSDNITEFKGIPVEHFETMEDAWYSTFGNTNSDYLVIDLMTDYPGIVVFENISEEYTHSSILNTVTELKQYVGYSETYRGIEFSHSTKHNYTGYVDLLPGTVEIKLGHYNFVKLATKKSLTAFEVSTMLDAVKQANEWLGVNTVKVPSTEEAIQPFDYSVELAKLKAMNPNDFMQLIKFTQHVKNFSSCYVPKTEVIQSYLTISEWEQVLESTDCDAWLKVLDIENCFSEAGNYHYSLTPKLELFTRFTEFTYLANCWAYLLSELTKYNTQWNKLISNFSSSVFDSWYSVNGLVHKSYIPQPLPSHDDYVTMLQLL